MEPKWIIGKSATVNIMDTTEERTVYSNLAAVMISHDDVLIHFAIRHMDDPNIGDGVAKVYLNLAHAKRLANALSFQINNYEKMFGEIKADPVASLSLEQLKQTIPPDQLKKILTPEQLKQIGIIEDAK